MTNKRIKKKSTKRLTEIMQELNVLKVMKGDVEFDNDLNVTKGNLWRVSGVDDIDEKAIKRVKKSLDKAPATM